MLTHVVCTHKGSRTQGMACAFFVMALRLCTSNCKSLILHHQSCTDTCGLHTHKGSRTQGMACAFVVMTLRLCTFVSVPPMLTCIELTRTVNIWCIYGIFCREITKYTVIYGLYIRFWPTQTCVVCMNTEARARGLVFCATNVDMCGLHKLTSESTWPWFLCYQC